jgi:hypothetical protein
VFNLPQRLVVPLFQRPYVWNEENQWEPLWDDVVRVAERLLSHPSDRTRPHFLGAVVLQQVQQPTGFMQERTIIDGQQRLTTLQLLLDALHAELTTLSATPSALRIEPLVANGQAFCGKPEDRFKVWPTNRDRAPFNAVMGALPPVDYDAVGHRGERMVEAHRYFAQQARKWLTSDGSADGRAVAIETAVRERLQIVVIDLGVDENAQEIFETLNARGAQLTAADLIKNFIFQQLSEGKVDVEAAYERNWKDFETAFWEAEVNVGRVRLARSSVFLNHWLISQTADEIVAREVFDRFKTFAVTSTTPMPLLLERIRRGANVYREFVTKADGVGGPIDRIGLFAYRTGVLESEIVKPLVLLLLDPDAPKIPADQLTKAFGVLESWMLRRMMVRATTKSYNKVIADLISQLQKGGRENAGAAIEAFFARQTAYTSYWPDDSEVVTELRDLPVYRRWSRGRLRMVLEALEDHKRGWRGDKPGFGEQRVPRGKLTIEHVMPQKWSANWPAADGSLGEAGRDRLVHTVGNLTLLMQRLNAKVSNGPWEGPGGKRKALEDHSVLFLNKELLAFSDKPWTDAAIGARTEHLTRAILEIWPVPAGHHSPMAKEKVNARRKVQLVDLINGHYLEPGLVLLPKPKKYAGRSATLLADGRIDVGGTVYDTARDAATAIAGKKVGGWWFLVDPTTHRSLKEIKQEYVNALAVEADEDDADDADDEDEG